MIERPGVSHRAVTLPLRAHGKSGARFTRHPSSAPSHQFPGPPASDSIRSEYLLSLFDRGLICHPTIADLELVVRVFLSVDQIC